ncbi:MAG: hypothetical protein CVU42_15870 [Chloroflexi bacterium HGW-Chloroflexi-4]|nr:MAG: hypothetical protein CVU42_15870 [Chloroflexi bacterium HGW-Chloroflexi-4]
MKTTEANNQPTNRVAVLGVLADLHGEEVQYDLKPLRRLILEIQPDLICAEIQWVDWLSGNLAAAPRAIRETIVPLCRRTNMVIIPVGGSVLKEFGIPTADRFLKAQAIRALNGLQRISWAVINHPAAINSAAYSHCCDLTCAAELNLCGQTAKKKWKEANDTIIKNILETLTRDPGRRVLVTVDCRRRQWLIKQLAQSSQVVLVHYKEL